MFHIKMLSVRSVTLRAVCGGQAAASAHFRHQAASAAAVRRDISRHFSTPAPAAAAAAAATARAKEIKYPPFMKKYIKFDTLVDIQRASCEKYKNLNFLGTWKGDKFEYKTYKQFGDDVDRFRTVLAHFGVGKDDKVWTDYLCTA
jgi:hypothetical protein